MGSTSRIAFVARITPFNYTHDLKPGLQYPGMNDVDRTGTFFVDKAYLDGYLKAVKTYGQQKGVPVAITEWGGHRTAANVGAYMRDRIDLQDSIGNWAVWTWQPAGFMDPFSAHDPSPTNTAQLAAWASNCRRPN